MVTFAGFDENVCSMSLDLDVSLASRWQGLDLAIDILVLDAA